VTQSRIIKHDNKKLLRSSDIWIVLIHFTSVFVTLESHVFISECIEFGILVSKFSIETVNDSLLMAHY